MRVDDLDYHLPDDLVAQVPAARREDARLLVLDRARGDTSHGTIADLAEWLRPGDLLVLNDTRVLPARLFARRASRGRVELLALAPVADPPGAWQVLAKARGTLRPDEVLEAGGGGHVRLVAAEAEGRWVAAGVEAPIADLLRRCGRMPLPPYIRRDDADPREALDRERYQTVYAKSPGAIAAPTAGLHLTEALLEDLAARGVARTALTLHVGLGTFEPVRTDRLEEHVMHEEVYEVPSAAVDAVRRTRAAGGRLVAVGTTSVRALESAAAAAPDGLPRPGAGRTRLLIAPGYRFRAVDALLTNFHLPRSTLIALVAAFAGRERILAAYAEAVRERYRFYSYGDAMLIL